MANAKGMSSGGLSLFKISFMEINKDLQFEYDFNKHLRLKLLKKFILL